MNTAEREARIKELELLQAMFSNIEYQHTLLMADLCVDAGCPRDNMGHDALPVCKEVEPLMVPLIYALGDAKREVLRRCQQVDYNPLLTPTGISAMDQFYTDEVLKKRALRLQTQIVEHEDRCNHNPLSEKVYYAGRLVEAQFEMEVVERVVSMRKNRGWKPPNNNEVFPSRREFKPPCNVGQVADLSGSDRRQLVPRRPVSPGCGVDG